jgi:hypothetical protein
MEYEASRRMPADSATTFGVASDIALMRLWMPSEIEVHPTGLDDVVEADVRLPHESGHEQGLFNVAPDQLRVEWGSRDGPEYGGWLQVADQADGASEVTIHLSFLDDRPEARDHGRARHTVQHMLEHSLERLSAEVARRAGR